MYTIWTKLTSIEDILIGNADEVVDYLKINYFSPIQQIRSMLSERSSQLKRNSLQELTNNSTTFHFLQDSDSSFDSLCEYIGFIMYSYNGKSEFILNEQQYQRGDILIKDINNIRNSSSILRLHTRNQQIYNNLYKSLWNLYFKKVPYENFVGLGIIYEQYKWRFDAFIIGSDVKRTLFTIDERRLLEMYILSWTKNMNDQVSIRDDARKMLAEQMNYVLGLLETQRSDMENIWSSKEVDIAIKVFERECQDEIDALFQIPPVFNTFTNLRDRIQLKNENRLSLISETFELRRLTLETQPSESLLCQIWKQLKTIEYSLRKKDFNSLNFNTITSIESLLSIDTPLFLNQLGICPESDSFDTKLNYIGLLIYFYNNQNEFILNKHQCKCGQLLIRQKQKLIQFVQTPIYKQTSFAPLFIHEYLYELYFKEKPNENFQGIGFVYEHGKWKFDVITYGGKYGIYSTYDIRGDNRMEPNINEQHCIDLILSTLYINNKWKEELGCMYTIDELEIIGRELFRKEIEIIEELYEKEKQNFNKTQYLAFKYLIEQYKPEPNMKPITLKTDKIIQLRRSLSPETQENINDASSPRTSIQSQDSNTQQKSKFYPSIDNLNTTSEQTQASSILQNSSSPIKPSKPRATPKPNAFFNVRNPLRKRSTSHDSLSASNTLFNSNSSLNHTESDETSSLSINKIQSNNSLSSSKEKEPISLYQLWQELNDIEQKLLHNFDLIQFINYLTKKEYLNSNEIILCKQQSDDEIDEYNLMIKIKIDSLLEFIIELFNLKRTKSLQKQTNQEKKQLDELFKAFEKYYRKQIEQAKKSLKSK